MALGSIQSIFDNVNVAISGTQLPTAPVPQGVSPAMPGSTLQSVAPLPPDTLQIGNQLIGQGVRVGEIRQLAPGLTPEEAAKLTVNNGMDEVYFTDEAGKNFVAFVDKSHFEDIRPGYFGRFNGSRVKVTAVDDENNTFKEGFTSVWMWVHHALSSAFGTEASKSINGLVTTAVGSFVAAAALKTTAPVAAAPTAGGFLKGVGDSMTGAFHGFINTMASIVLFAVGAVGAASLFNGVRAYYSKGNMTTLDMVTGKY